MTKHTESPSEGKKGPCPRQEDLLRNLRAQAHGNPRKETHEIIDHLENCARCQEFARVLGWTDPILNRWMTEGFEDLLARIGKPLPQVVHEAAGIDSQAGRKSGEPDLPGVLKICKELAEAKDATLVRARMERIRMEAEAWMAEHRDTAEYDAANVLYSKARSRINSVEGAEPLDVTEAAAEVLVALFHIQFALPDLQVSNVPALSWDEAGCKIRFWVWLREDEVPSVRRGRAM